MRGAATTDEERGDPALLNDRMRSDDLVLDAGVPLGDAFQNEASIQGHGDQQPTSIFQEDEDAFDSGSFDSDSETEKVQEDGSTASSKANTATKLIQRHSTLLTSTSSVPDENESETGSGRNSMERSRALKWYCFVVLYVLQLIGSPFFLYWLLTSAWNHESPVASALFFCAEVIAYVSSSLFLFTGLFSAKKKPGRSKGRRLSRSDNEKPHVAVCLCRYKEPLEDLFVSVGCMLDIDWPADKLHLFILDDGFYYQSEGDQKKQMVKLSQAIDGAKAIPSDHPQSSFRVQPAEDLHRSDCAVESHSWTVRPADGDERCEVTLLARKKGDVSHFKAGNINNFLYNHLGELASSGEKPAMEFMLLLDHDMMAAPNVLNEAMTRFEQENLAFVQYPQRFFDIVTNDRFYAGNEIFFDGVCQNRSRLGLAPFAGTNAIWRLRSLYSVGGFQYGSITEDASTGFAAHRHGFTSEYIAREVCVGQSPQTLPDAMQQRMRWSQGSIEISVQMLKSLFCRDLTKPFPCPQVLEAEYNLATPIHSSVSCGRSILLAIIYADSLIYPFYSFGFLFHVGVCLTYLINAQAPMAPSDPAHVIFFWLPLHVVKVFCQVFAFPMVSLNVQLIAQKAWAGYAVSTIVSIKTALFTRTSGWFNTGSGNKDRFLTQYVNTFLFAAIAVLMVYRVVAFTAIEGTCRAWMTFGALVYGFMMAWLLEMWALEPFVSVPEEEGGAAAEEAPNDDAIVPQENEASALRRASTIRRARRTSLLHKKSSFGFAMREAVSTKASRRGSVEGRLRQAPRRLSADLRQLSTCEGETGNRNQLKSAMAQKRVQELIGKREAYERHYPNITILINFVAVIMVSFTLLVWATGNCDSKEFPQGQLVVDVHQTYSPEPPLPIDASPKTEFLAVGGGLTLNGEQFSLKGVNWFGFETTRKVPFGMNVVSQDSVLETMAKNGINAVRLPLLVEGIMAPNDHKFPSWAVDTMLNPHLQSLDTYLDGVEEFIHRTSQWGIFTLLDMHLLRADTHPDPLPFDDKTSFEDLVRAWEILSERFCAHWGVMGADLKNEPFEATWGDGNTGTDWKFMAERLGDVVSRKCPSWLIFVEGIWRYEDESIPLQEVLPPWGSMLVPASKNPVVIQDETKLVYSPHVYGPGTLGLKNTPIFGPNNYCDELCLMCYCKPPVEDLKYLEGLKCSTSQNGLYEGVEDGITPLGSVPTSCSNVLPFEGFPQNIPPYYDQLFGFLVNQNRTVIVGEWGGTYTNGVSEHLGLTSSNERSAHREAEAKWNEEILDYLVSKNIGSFYWSINPESDDTGGLLLSDWVNEDTAKMALLKRLPSTPTLPLLFPKTVNAKLRQCLGNLEIVYKVSGARYTVEANGYNKDYDGSKQPEAIVFAASEDQVATSVRCANELNYKICVRSGGHSYTGDSLCDGVLIDLHHMKRVTQLDDAHFEVESGNTMGDLTAALSQHGRIAPAGNHNGVGSGWLLGCGRGALSRKFGLGCDYLVSARMVTGTGKIVEATDSNEHSDLLWALRGAGGGHFGVVVSYSIETMPLPEDDAFSTFKLSYPRDMAKRAYTFWQSWAIEHPDPNFTCSYVLWNRAEDTVLLEGNLIGTSEELENILDEPLAMLGTPQGDERESFGYLDFFAHAYGSFDVLQFRNPQAGWSGERRSFRNKSHLLKHGDLTADGVDTLVKHANELIPGSSAYSNYIELSPLGGAIKTPPRPSAFSHRSAVAVAQYGGYWEESEAKRPMVSHQRRFRSAMEQFWGNDAFYNYKDNDLLDWEEAYFGKLSLTKLREVKCRYDAENKFSVMRQSIWCEAGSASEEKLMQ